MFSHIGPLYILDLKTLIPNQVFKPFKPSNYNLIIFSWSHSSNISLRPRWSEKLGAGEDLDVQYFITD